MKAKRGEAQTATRLSFGKNFHNPDKPEPKKQKRTPRRKGTAKFFCFSLRLRVFAGMLLNGNLKSWGLSEVAQNPYEYSTKRNVFEKHLLGLCRVNFKETPLKLRQVRGKILPE